MKKLTSAIIISALSLSLMGCAVDKPGTNNAHAEPTRIPVTGELEGRTLPPIGTEQNITVDLGGKALYWDMVRYEGSPEDKLRYRVFNDYESFSRELGKYEPGEKFDEKSFDKDFVVAVYCTVSSGGFKFGVNSASIRDGVVSIDISRTSPAPGSMVTTAFEHYCLLVAFDSSLYSDELTYNISINGKPETAELSDGSAE